MRRTFILPPTLLLTVLLLVANAGCNGSEPECVTDADCTDSDGCTTVACIDGEESCDPNSGADSLNFTVMRGEETLFSSNGLISRGKARHSAERK